MWNILLLTTIAIIVCVGPTGICMLIDCIRNRYKK